MNNELKAMERLILYIIIVALILTLGISVLRIKPQEKIYRTTKIEHVVDTVYIPVYVDTTKPKGCILRVPGDSTIKPNK